MDTHTNFGYTRVTDPPFPPESGEALEVADASVFGAPPFNVVVWPHVPAVPTAANAEILRVTSVNTGSNVIGFDREQEGTDARTITSGDQIAAVITEKMIDDILAEAGGAALAAHVGASDPHTGYQRESEKNTANGYAGLDGSGLVPDARIPSGVTRDSELTAAIAALVNAAPGTLDTLAELAAALGNDPNLATTLTTLIGTKVATADLEGLVHGFVDETKFSLTLDGDPVTLDPDDASVQYGTLEADTTITLPDGLDAGKPISVTLVLTQDGTGGWVVTFAADGVLKTGDGAAIELSTDADAVDVVELLTLDGGDSWLVFVAGVGMVEPA